MNNKLVEITKIFSEILQPAYEVFEVPSLVCEVLN